MESYFDLVTRHELFIQKFASHLRNEYTKNNLNESHKAVAKILNEMDGKSINAITKAITKELLLLGGASWDGLTEELNVFAVSESQHFAKLFEQAHAVALIVPTAKSLLDSINKTMMMVGSGTTEQAGFWADYVAASNSDVVKMVNNQVRAGYGKGETLRTIVNRVKMMTDGLLSHRTEALVRTATNFYATQSRESVVSMNLDVIESRYFNSVFDNRRTLICTAHASSDKNPWKVSDKTAPVFPLHFGERSTWVFLLKGQKNPDGTRASVGGVDTEEAADRYNRRSNSLKKRRDNPDIEGRTSSKVKYRGRKDSDTFKAGQIDGATKGDDFVRSQPKFWIESFFGSKTKADLFISGKVDISGFVDEATGKPFTLKQIYKDLAP